MPIELGERAEHGTEDRAEDRDAERRADHLAAPLARRRDGEPRERSCPRRGARDALDEARAAECERAVRGSEREARDGEQEEPCDDGALRPEPRSRQPARDAAEERARAVRADEEPCAGLREAELLRVRRDERRQRGEEQRVDEDDRADEEEQTAHAARG